MKNLLFISLFFTFTTPILAQENYKSQFGLKIQNFQSYGNRYGITQPVINFIYKKQISEKKYRRIDFGFTIAKDVFSTSLRVGNEKHIHLFNKLDFIHGAFLEAQYSSITFNERRSQSLNLGVGYLIGLEYNVGKRMTFGVSISPTIMTNIHNDRNGWSNFSGYYIQPNVAIHFTYKF